MSGEGNAEGFAATQLDATPDGNASSTPQPSLVRGCQIGRFVVVDTLGAGGMGVVYSAYDPQLDRKVAVKLLRAQAMASDEAQTRLLREAQAMARIDHPNVLRVYEAGTFEDQIFIAMELAPGGTLRNWLATATRSPREIIATFVQAGRGLASAHAAGLVHRDFKPDNVLLFGDGRIRVTDFGLVGTIGEPVEGPPARLSGPIGDTTPLSQSLTRTGVVMGTPTYMAPEQFHGEAVGPAADQFAFCVALYEALYGERPFAGDSFAELCANVVSGERRAVPRRAGVPTRVKLAVARGLASDPKRRHASMEALLRELAPPRRRWPWLVGGAVVIAAVTGLVAFAGARDQAVWCTDGTRQLAGAWDPIRRQQLERAFAATGAPYAPAETAAVIRALDRYAAAWAWSYDGACRATRASGERSYDLLDWRNGCLAMRRTELASVVDTLTRADAATVERAHATVATMSSVSSCDVTALQRDREPDDPEVRKRVSAIRTELAELSAANDVGRNRDVLGRGAALLARARAAGYRPVIASIVAILGIARRDAGDLAGAKRDFEDCIEITRDLSLAVDATVCLANLAQLAAHEHDFDRAHQLLVGATTAAANTPSPLLRAYVVHTRGVVAASEGKLEAALAMYEQANTLQDQNGLAGAERARTLQGIAEADDELGHYVEARKAAEQARMQAESEVGPWHPLLASVLIVLGNIDADEGDATAAADAYARALAIHERAGNAGGQADVLNNLGDIAVQNHRLDEALDYERRALAIREQLDPDGASVAMSLTNIAGILRMKHDCTGALATLARSLPLAERLGKDHPYVADALVELGTCRLEQRDLAGAQTVLERALAIRTAGARPSELAGVQFALARTQWERGQYDPALTLAHAAREAFSSTAAAKDDLAEVDAWLANHNRSKH